MRNEELNGERRPRLTQEYFSIDLNKEDFQIRYKLLKLDGPTIDRIRQMEDGEDRDARYGLGRYLYVVRPEEDWGRPRF